MYIYLNEELFKDASDKGEPAFLIGVHSESDSEESESL
jgi:hypothetical protein